MYVVGRVTLPDAQLRRAVEGRWGTILSFATWTMLPTLYGGTVASLILPFAVGNAIVAGTIYGVADIAIGGPSSPNESFNKIRSTPYIFGSGIGATVGYVAPHYLYGPLLEQMYGMDDMSSLMHHMLSLPYITSTSLVTGALAGMLLHPLLYYPVHGIPGYHWKQFSGVALATSVAALFYVYRGREDAKLPIPEGSCIEPSQREIVDSILRYDVSCGEVRTYSLYKGKYVGTPEKYIEGRSIAEACRSYSGKSKLGNWGVLDESMWGKWGAGWRGTERVVFDDRILAFVYNYWDANTKARYPENIVNIKSVAVLQNTQNSVATTDLIVASILQNQSFDADQMMKVLTIIDNLISENNKGRKLTPYQFKQLKEVSSAIELLMLMKQSNQLDVNDELVETLEKFVWNRYPELSLYSADELYRDISVESQLRIANWNGQGLSDALDKWKSVQEYETRRIRMRRSLFVVSGILLSIAGSMIRGNM